MLVTVGRYALAECLYLQTGCNHCCCIASYILAWAHSACVLHNIKFVHTQWITSIQGMVYRHVAVIANCCFCCVWTWYWLTSIVQTNGYKTSLLLVNFRAGNDYRILTKDQRIAIFD